MIQETKAPHKDCLRVRFYTDKFQQEMLLREVPRAGDYFQDPEHQVFKITKVIYMPWNAEMEHVQIVGEKVE